MLESLSIESTRPKIQFKRCNYLKTRSSTTWTLLSVIKYSEWTAYTGRRNIKLYQTSAWRHITLWRRPRNHHNSTEFRRRRSHRITAAASPFRCGKSFILEDFSIWHTAEVRLIKMRSERQNASYRRVRWSAASFDVRRRLRRNQFLLVGIVRISS